MDIDAEISEHSWNTLESNKEKGGRENEEDFWAIYCHIKCQSDVEYRLVFRCAGSVPRGSNARQAHATGQTPPITERIPKDPWVISTVEQIGIYGGTIKTVALGPNTPCDGDYLRSESLFFTDQACRKVIPNLARGYEFSSDRKKLTIHLRKGLRWSDGYPVTADDAMFWWNDILCNEELTPVKPKVWLPGGKVPVLEKVDDYTIRFHFAVPWPGILGQLSWGNNPILRPKHYLKRWHIKYNPAANELARKEGFDTWYKAFQFHADSGPAQQDLNLPVLGAYVLKERSTTRKSYERNPYFGGVDPAGNQLPYIDRLVVEIVSNSEVANVKTIAGEFDFAGMTLDTENYALYRENAERGGYRVLLWPTTSSAQVALAFNQNHTDPVLRKIFMDVRFRQAMSLAINREEINQFAYLGTGVPCQATVPPNCSFYKEKWGLAYAEYDPMKANKLLDEIGLEKRDRDGYRIRPDGKPLAITLEWAPVAGNIGTSTVCELIASYWKAVGVKTEVKQQERSLLLTRVQAGLADVGIREINNILQMRAYIPGNSHWHPRMARAWGPKWGLWYDTGGKSGEEPTGEAREFLETWDRWHLATTDEDYHRLAQMLWDNQARNLWIIGTVGYAKCPIVVKNTLHNMPKECPWGNDLAWWRVASPEQWFPDVSARR